MVSSVAPNVNASAGPVLRYSKAHRRVVRRVAAAEQDQLKAEAQAQALTAHGRKGTAAAVSSLLTAEQIALLTSRATLDLKQSKHWVAHALDTQSRLANLPIAEAFSQYTQKEINRTPLCL